MPSRSHVSRSNLATTGFTYGLDHFKSIKKNVLAEGKEIHLNYKKGSVSLGNIVSDANKN
jgi:hypothetical protein